MTKIKTTTKTKSTFTNLYQINVNEHTEKKRGAYLLNLVVGLGKGQRDSSNCKLYLLQAPRNQPTFFFPGECRCVLSHFGYHQ